MPKHAPVFVPKVIIERLVREGLVLSDPEFSRAYWFGVILTFSDEQLACWNVLWNNFLRGNLPIPHQRIISAASGNTTHITHHFKRHPARLQNVIVGDGRGYYWLHVPKQYLEEEAA